MGDVKTRVAAIRGKVVRGAGVPSEDIEWLCDERARLLVRVADREEELRAREDSSAVKIAREHQRTVTVYARRVEEADAKTRNMTAKWASEQEQLHDLRARVEELERERDEHAKMRDQAVDRMESALDWTVEMQLAIQERIAERDEARLSLRNVLMLATLMRRAVMQGRERNGLDDAEQLIRFCKEAGVEPSILRDEPRPSLVDQVREHGEGAVVDAMAAEVQADIDDGELTDG